MAPASAFLEVTGDTLGIPPFLWGCILGVIGILLVYIISDNNKEATRKALVGCLVGYGTALVVYLILVFAVWGSFAAAASSI